MSLEGILVEAHSYSGGLRQTPFVDGGRPSWAPPPDSVGWRDDFEFSDQDTVVEFHQRQFEGSNVSWLACYYRSTDTRLGDRRNHAGVGIWLKDKRIGDARALLSALSQLSIALAQNPDPSLLISDVSKFASSRFLGSYVLPAGAFPDDWSGAPSSSEALVDTAYKITRGQDLNSATERVGEEITKLSLSWLRQSLTPRTVILITPNAAKPSERDFVELEPAGSFLADLLEKWPDAFAKQRDELRSSELDFAKSLAAWKEEKRIQQEIWDKEKREQEMLDGKPATLEGIAARLNQVSKQIEGVSNSLSRSSQSTYKSIYEPIRSEPRRPTQPYRAESNENSGRIFWIVVSVAITAILVFFVTFLVLR